MFNKMEELCEMCENIRMTILGGCFLALSLILMLCGVHPPLDPAWGTALICGFPLAYHAVKNLSRGHISSDLLVTVAMVASVCIGEDFAAGEIAFIMALGEYLEDRTVARARKGLASLLELAPRMGRRITASDGKEDAVEIPAETIEKGWILRVLPGETIPVDGIVVRGNTSVDQSVMTGESLPVDKGIGDSVFGGTVNRFGAIDIEATRVGADSSLQKMISLVQEAEKNKAPTQRIVDKWAAWLVPAAMLLAVAAYLGTQNVTRAVTVLVVFCPCALALATPTSIMAAIGQAAKRGVLIKSGEALETMGRVNCVTFDKTGTLTFGRLEVSDVIPSNGTLSADELLHLAALAEAQSEHPIGKAIAQAAIQKDMDLPMLPGFETIPGKGVSANRDGKRILCGSLRYLDMQGVSIPESAKEHLNTLRMQGKATVVVAESGRFAGIVGLSDVIRPAAANVVAQMRKLGVEVVLLTGDHRQTAEYFASQTGISEIHAELLPEQKVMEIARLRDQGKTVCMIGDGVNDAPAIKTADVGAAMAAMGSDIAIEAADVALMGDNLEHIPYLKRLASAAIFSIHFNITLAMLINVLAIVLSVLGYLTPVLGALVHNAGSVIVVLNAAILYDRKI